MNDDQLDVKLEAGEEASVSEPSTEEPKATEEVETPESEATVEESEETQTETEEAPKKGANQRIRELNAKAKSAEEKAKSLEQKLAELTGQVDQQMPQAPYQPQVSEGSELTTEQYKQDVMRTAESLVSLKIKQSEAITRINSEAQQVVQLFPQLDPDHVDFDRELSDSITEATEAYVKANPYTASPKKFVEKMMKPYTRAVQKEVGKVTENIAKQVSETATRPTSVSTKGGKTHSDKSIAELEKELGFVN